MDVTLFSGCVAALLVTYYVFNNVFRKSVNYKLPNGPWGFSFLGNILQMLNTYPHLKLTLWAQQYGALYTIHIGTRPALIVNDAKVLKQLLSMSAATGKFKTATLLLLSQGPYGILMVDGGEHHSEQRTAALKAMKAVGFGRGVATEEKTNIWEEIPKTCDAIESTMTDEITSLILFDYIHQTMSNTLWRVVSGEILTGNNSSKISLLLCDFMKALQYCAKTGLHFLPWLRHVAPHLSGYEQLKGIIDDFRNLLEIAFEREKNTWRDDVPPRHAIDYYIEQLRKHQNNPASSFHGKIGMKNSMASLVELFLAAVETTTATLTWVLFYLSCNPNIQEKLQEEIDMVVGKNRSPSLKDRQSMPFTEAVILEGSRYSSVASLGTVHELIEDVPNFLGYSLPKGLIIVSNLYGIHQNKKTWDDPDVFRPERFLNEDTDQVQKLRENTVPFQTGRRVCLGEQQAKDFMFLMLTHVLQKFQLKPDPSIPRERYFDVDVGIGLLPKPLPLEISLRI